MQIGEQEKKLSSRNAEPFRDLTCAGVINLKLGGEMIAQYGELTTEETCITCQTATRGGRQQGRHVPRGGGRRGQ